MDDFSDNDIKVLIKITLRTQTNNIIKICLPFNKHFCPETILTPNTPVLIPIFNTLELVAHTQTDKEKAIINIEPLLPFLNHEHYLNVQTYLLDQP